MTTAEEERELIHAEQSQVSLSLVRRFIGWFLAFFLCVSTAYATDLHCGRDTDRSGTASNPCAGPDADFDGYASVADGGTDCDDTNWAIYPGVSTEGSSNNTFKTCQSDGSYTASAALSGYSCKTNSGSNYWVDPAASGCSHAATFADPKNIYCYFDTGMSGYTAPSGDDCIISLGGTLSSAWGTTKMLYSQTSGTSGHKIHFEVAPGKELIIDSPGTSPTKIRPIQLISANYWTFNGNAIGTKPGLNLGDGYANDGIACESSTDITVQNAYVHDVDGAQNSGDNGGGVDIGNGGACNNFYLHHSHIKDNYSRAQPTNLNNNQIDVFRGTGLRVEYNTIEDTVSGGAGNGFFYKHCDSSGNGSWTVKGNVFSGASNRQLWDSCGGATIERNVFLNPNKPPISLDGGNGATYFATGSTIQYNTVVNGAGPELFTTGSYEQSSSFGLVTVQKNIFNDSRASSYNGDGTTGFYRICHYCSDSIYTALITGGKIAFASNDLNNSAGTALFFTVFGDGAGSGTTAANFSAWQGLGLGLTTSEININPQLDADNIARATGTEDMGWRTQNDVGPTPTPSPSPSPSPTPSPAGGFTAWLQ